MTSVTRPVPDVGLPPGLVVVEAPHADHADVPEAWAYRAVADLDAEIERETHGDADMALSVRDVVTGMQHQEYEEKQRFVVVRADALDAAGASGGASPAPHDVVGHLLVCRPVTSNTHLGEVYVFVRPGARRQGIGNALLALGERLAVGAGRTVLYSATAHGTEPPAGEGAVEATTGSGRVPADAPGVRLALAHGYVLEQVDRHSVLDLPLPPGLLDRQDAAARAAVGDDYRALTWADDVPEAWADQVALLFTRMSTDAPVGGVDYDEDPWDEARVRAWVRERRERGHAVLMTVAEHVPTRTLAAFTVLEHPRDRPAVVHQEDTLVLREHRGRRLGMHVKVVNLRALGEAWPQARRVHTGNAEENAHMLAINVALGFRPAGTWASWQKRVGATRTTASAPAPRVRIETVDARAGLHGPGAWALHGTVLVSEAVDEHVYGHTDLSLDPGTVLNSVASGGYRRTVRRVAVADGAAPGSPARPEDVVGRSMVSLPLEGSTHVALVHVAVRPEHRRRGVGGALWEDALAIARDAGRHVVQGDSSFAPEPPPGPDALEAPTGSGRVPRDADATAFVLHRGFTLEQVQRHSVLDLPVPAERLDPLRAASTGRAAGYRLHVWTDDVPERWLDQLAVLETRMSTDAPTAGLESEEDPWDAQRVRTTVQDVRDRGQGFVLAAAEHGATGTLAGFSMVTYPLDKPAVVYQEDTLVLREHRGRSLGMLVKVAVLDELARSRPAAQRVHTWNAQENDHMLAINVALGFAPASVDAEWQLRLDEPG